MDSPTQAVSEAGQLVTAVMAERGYPTEDLRQAMQHYRALFDDLLVDVDERQRKAAPEDDGSKER